MELYDLGLIKEADVGFPLTFGSAEVLTKLVTAASELARSYGAEAPEPTPDPNVAYADAPRRTAVEPPPWPLR